ncbi:MAG TPA: BadF/BadG/BcrA/BcrD ATPase family protein [Actinomycetota bacterium]
MGQRRLLAADGGGSKTDLVLLDEDGAVLAAVRGPGSNPDNVGAARCVAILDALVTRAALVAGLDGQPRPIAELGAYYLSGLDFPAQERDLGARVAACRWSAASVVGNDCFAALRAGASRGWGVAVVCGTGINCVAVSPSGRHARYPALGPLTGDWGGAADVGMAALAAAIRSQDGRGPRTSLQRSVAAHFGLRQPQAAGIAIFQGRLPERALEGLPPLLFAAARDGDGVAGGIVDRLADEVVAMAAALLRRLRLTRSDAEIVLGGGILQAGDDRLTARVHRGIQAVAPHAQPITLALPPVTGAALLALEAAGASPAATSRARAQVPAALRDPIPNPVPDPTRNAGRAGR